MNVTFLRESMKKKSFLLASHGYEAREDLEAFLDLAKDHVDGFGAIWLKSEALWKTGPTPC